MRNDVVSVVSRTEAIKHNFQGAESKNFEARVGFRFQSETSPDRKPETKNVSKYHAFHFVEQKQPADPWNTKCCQFAFSEGEEQTLFSPYQCVLGKSSKTMALVRFATTVHYLSRVRTKRFFDCTQTFDHLNSPEQI